MFIQMLAFAVFFKVSNNASYKQNGFAREFRYFKVEI